MAGAEGKDGGHSAPIQLAFLLGVFLLSHPYQGVIHDGILYAVQGLRRLEPDVYSQDLFFKYGSQDDFSAFSVLYAVLIRQLDVPAASMAAVGTGQLLWFGGAVLVARAASSGQTFLVGTTFVLSLACFYGYGAILQVGEGFATPRLFAEAFGLLSIAAMLRGRPWLGLAGAGASLALHPLMAVAPVLACCLLWAQSKRDGLRRAVTVATVAFGIGGLVALLAPSALRVMDGAWYEVVQLRNPMVAPDVWSLNDWATLAFPVLLLVLVASIGGACRPLATALAGAGIVGLALSLLAEHTRWVLLVQGQPWRAVWLPAMLGPVVVIGALSTLGAERPALRAMLFATLPVFVFLRETALGVGGIAAMGFLVPLWAVARFERDLHSRVLKHIAVAWCVLGVSLALAWSLMRAAALARGTLDAGGDGWQQIEAAARPFTWLVFPILGAWMGSGRASRPVGASAALLPAAFVVGGIVFWDARLPLVRFLEAGDPVAVSHWRRLVSPTESVLWQGRVQYPWLLLRRSSYLSTPQLAGAVFSRAMTMEALRRLAFTRELGFSYGSIAVQHGAPMWWEAAEPDRAGLIAACRDPELDFVVLRRRVADDALATMIEPTSRVVYFLYGCASRRARAGVAEGGTPMSGGARGR